MRTENMYASCFIPPLSPQRKRYGKVDYQGASIPEIYYTARKRNIFIPSILARFGNMFH